MISTNNNKPTPYLSKSHNGRSNKCRAIRIWLHKARGSPNANFGVWAAPISSRFGLDAGWVQNHIANCQRCQRRFVDVGLINLALSVMKSQPHRLDLLMRANTQAVGVLKHNLRRAPKAQKLRVMRPEPKLIERCSKYTHPTANVAACIAILLLMKIGIFTSMDKFQNQGQKVVEKYYAIQVGEDLADEVFSALPITT